MHGNTEISELLLDNGADPNHQIQLFNISNNLYCFVEIFGCIQKYVHLSDKYKGIGVAS